MTRIRAWFAAASVAVVASLGALLLPDALEQQASIVSPRMSCEEWQQVIARREDRRMTFWVVVPQAVIQAGIPPAHGNRVLGVQEGRTMGIARSDCPGTYSYTFDPGPATHGVRIARTDADPYIARSWQRYAEDTLGVVYLGTYAEAPQACVDNAAELGLVPGIMAKCRDLLRSGNDCWVQDDGRLCRGGAYPAPDVDGNPVPCTVTATSTWHPCSVYAGENPIAIQSATTTDLSGE